MEVLPIRSITDEDARIFGALSVSLAKLARGGLPAGDGIVVTAPEFKLKSILEHYDFGKHEIFQQSLDLVNKEINQIPTPEILTAEVKKIKKFLIGEKETKKIKDLWLALLSVLIEQIKNRLWEKGFYPGITEGLDSQIVIFIKNVEASGRAYFDPLQDDVEVQVKKGRMQPREIKAVAEIVQEANKKLFIPHEYDWILDGRVKLIGIKPYTPPPITMTPYRSGTKEEAPLTVEPGSKKMRSAVKVFFELSKDSVVQKEADGIYIDSGKIFDLNKPKDSFEDLAFKLVESAMTFPNSPVFLKLADKSEGMGTVRGTLRLIHQKSLFDPLVEALDFARHKRGLTNVHLVIPFLRGVNELLQIKRDLAVKKLSRKNSLKQWVELSVPENIVNLDSYLVAGIDGVILHLDELISYLNGFDSEEGELIFYKNEVDGLLKFLDDGIKLLHKSGVPFIAYGSLTFNPKVLEFLVEKGLWGIVAQKYEAHSAYDLLQQTEKRVFLRRS